MEARIGRGCFELWFEARNSLVVSDNRLVVNVSDEFSMDRIQNNHLNDLKSLAQEFELEGVSFSLQDPDAPIAEDDPELVSIGLESADGKKSLAEADASAVGRRPGSDLGSKVFSPDPHCTDQSTDQTTLLIQPNAKNQPNLEDQPDAKSDSGRDQADRGMDPGTHSKTASSKTVNSKTVNSKPANSRSLGNRKNRLTNFVVDPQNRMLWNACQQVLKNPGDLSPFYIHGRPGSGKSHLLEGMAAAVRRWGKTGKVQLVTAEQFTTDFVSSIKNRTMPIFRKKYRELEFLLVDDIQFLAGKLSTLVEFQHTIEAILRVGGQVVLMSDRSPHELDFAGPELINRISSGLMMQLHPPSGETRIQIVQRLSAERGVRIDEEAARIIADRISGDVRLLSGAVNRIKAYQLAEGRAVRPEELSACLADLVQVSRKTVTLKEIEKAVCELFGLDENVLRSASKVKAVSQPRMLAMWLSRKYTRAALSEIGEHFGGRAHSTVISAQSKVDQWIENGLSIGLKHTEFPVENAVRRIEQQLRVS